MSAHRYAGPRHARPAGPRHAKPAPPSCAHRTLAVGGLAAALVAGEGFALAGTAGAVTPDAWAQLRMCESSGNYATNTGNGYYGAYQFNLATWQGLGYGGLPSNAAPAVQDAAAQALYQQRGWEPWPACSAKLGLVDDRQASRDTTRPPLAPVSTPTSTPSSSPTSTPVATPVVVPVSLSTTPRVPLALPVSQPVTPIAAPTTVAPQWDGHYISVGDVGQVRTDVEALQQQLNAAGYHLVVDGRYGAQSAAAATGFEQSHALHVERPAVVGPQVWAALFAG